MLLKSMKLKNFRQYKGEQLIEFSTDPSRNVTVILGNNTSGKTTIVQAFNWALYDVAAFPSKDFLLNLDLSSALSAGDTQEVEVEVEVNHDKTDYVITRTQMYSCDSKGVVRPGQSVAKVSYREKNGQMEPIRTIAVKDTINKILPDKLASYFFFDGERIENISNKQDVTEAVKGLLGLSVLDNAMKHLDPGKKNSVIGKFTGSMDLAGNKKAKEALNRIQNNQERLNVIAHNLGNAREQIEYYEERKEELEDTIKEYQPTAKLQQDKERLEKSISMEETALAAAQDRLVSDFNNNPELHFAKPLIARALDLLKDARMSDKGIPNMNATSIDYVIQRGRCICGAEISDGSVALKHILDEREFLPPQSIGTLVKNFKDSVATYSNVGKNYAKNIQQSYADTFRSKTRIREWNDEVRSISHQIQGKPDMEKFERELQDVKKRLRDFNSKKEKWIFEQGACKNDIDKDKDRYNALVSVSEKNQKITQYIAYTQEIYDWIRDTYETKEGKIRTSLEVKINEIFGKMYHGKRRVTINSKYRVTLLTAFDDAEVQTDESKGLETVKNFAFVCGLVDLAREKITGESTDELELDLRSEPYPLVMDAPFSNADEIHVSNISKMLPEIAEQVIMVVMAKDWGFAESVIASRVGKKYVLEKKSETLTYIK